MVGITAIVVMVGVINAIAKAHTFVRLRVVKECARNQELADVFSYTTSAHMTGITEKGGGPDGPPPDSLATLATLRLLGGGFGFSTCFGALDTALQLRRFFR
jgi:hypothetical protein